MIGDEIFQYGEKIEWIGHIKSVPRTLACADYRTKSTQDVTLPVLCSAFGIVPFMRQGAQKVKRPPISDAQFET